MNHFVVAKIYAGMSNGSAAAQAKEQDIPGLQVAFRNRRPLAYLAKPGGAQTPCANAAALQAIVYVTGTVKGIGPFIATNIFFAQLRLSEIKECVYIGGIPGRRV